MRKQKQLVAVGCNIFAGLFTIGVKAEGFHVLAHLEHALDNSDIAKLNHPELEVFDGGPSSWPTKFKQPVDLVFCNPPCAVWSMVGRASTAPLNKNKISWHEDSRLQRAYDALRLIETYKPAVWIWESVPRSLTVGRTVIMQMAATGQANGYACSVVKFNARDVGVPQDRPRVFVVLHRYAFEPGPLTTRDAPILPRDVLKNMPKNAYVRDIEPLSNGERALLPHVKPGQSMRRVFDMLWPDAERNERGQVKGRSPFPSRRLNIDKPAFPMLQQTFHHKVDRHLSVAEALRLCGLPDDWKFPARRIDKLRSMQQSVMPAAGAWIARAAALSIKQRREAAIGAPLLYDLTGDELEITQFGLASDMSSSKPPRSAAPVKDKPARVERVPRAPTADAVEKAKRVCVGTTGSGARIRQLLLEKRPLDDDAIAALIRREFPGRKTTQADVAWNRGMLRKAGLLRRKT